VSAVAFILYAAGGALEIFGIILIGKPDLIPYGETASLWLVARYRGIVGRIRRRLGLPGREHKVSLDAGIVLASGIRATVIRGAPTDASLADQVAWLIQRDREAQEKQNAIEGRVEDLEASLKGGLERQGEELRAHVADAIKREQMRNRDARALGALVLIAGVVCATSANFV
jgi:hypothetical protein